MPCTGCTRQVASLLSLDCVGLISERDLGYNAVLRQGKVRRMRPSPFNKGSGAAKPGAAAAVRAAAPAAAPTRMATLSEADSSGEVRRRQQCFARPRMWGFHVCATTI